MRFVVFRLNEWFNMIDYDYRLGFISLRWNPDYSELNHS